MKTASIIIVNYNTAPLALQCIASVIQHTAADHEIILVDNHSAERDVETIPVRFPSVRLICLDENAGFGNACNTAARQAAGRYLFFLNPDTVLHNDAAGAFLEFYERQAQDLNIGCLGAVLTDTSGRPVHSAGKFPRAGALLREKCDSMFRRLLRIKMPEGQTDPFMPGHGIYRRVDYITGAALFISKQRFDDAGGFDPDYFMYFEETDLQLRLSQSGFYSYLVKGPEIIHFGGRSAVSKAQVRMLYFESLMKYMKKHNPRLKYLFFRAAWYVLDARTALQRRHP